MIFRLPILFSLSIFLYAQFSFGGTGACPASVYGEDKSSFAESFAKHISGIILEKDSVINNEEESGSSVIWIPTYYGYHSLLGVLETFIHKYTNITRLRTWRLADRNFYVIYLSQEERSIKIIYDSRESLLLLYLPTGY